MENEDSVMPDNIPMPMIDGDYEEETTDEKDERSAAETMRDEMNDLEDIEALNDEDESDEDTSADDEEDPEEEDPSTNIEDLPDAPEVMVDDDGGVQLKEAKKPYVPKMTSKGLPKLGVRYKTPKDPKKVSPEKMPKVAANSMRAMMNAIDEKAMDQMVGRRKKK